MRHRRTRSVLVASVLALGLTASLAACGGSGGKSEPSKVTTDSGMMNEQQMDQLQAAIEKSASEGSLASVVTTAG